MSTSHKIANGSKSHIPTTAESRHGHPADTDHGIRHKPRVALLFCAILASHPAVADEFFVRDAAELQQALQAAAGNDVNDTVRLADGTYATTDNGGPFVFNDDASHQITLVAEQRGLAILDGGGQHEVLVIKHASLGGKVFVDGLVLRKGTRGLRIENANVDIQHTQFLDNVLVNDATGAGGGGLSVPIRVDSVVIRDSHFARNSALPQNAHSYGGAAYLNAKDVTISRSQFSANLAHQEGGALSLRNTGRNATVEHCDFEANVAGPANLPSGGAIDSRTPLVLRHNLFHGNQARSASAQIGTSHGGAVMAIALTSTGDLFSENHADFGGALSASGAVAIDRAVFRENSSIDGGAAIGLNGMFLYSTQKIHNVLFIGNRDTGATTGSTLYCYRQCQIVNSLFDGNLTAATVYFARGSEANVNVIANSVFLGGGERLIDSNASSNPATRVTLINNFIDQERIATPAEFRHASGNFVTSDAGLDDHFRPVTGSVLIDSGLTQPALFTLPTSDHAGQARTAGMAVDVGPYEHASFSITDPGPGDGTDAGGGDGGANGPGSNLDPGTPGDTGNEVHGPGPADDSLSFSDAVGGGSLDAVGLLVLGLLAGWWRPRS